MAKGVTIESLAQRIAELESRPRSLNEDFQLEAYRELLVERQKRPDYWITYYPEKVGFDAEAHSESGPESCAKRIAKEIGGFVRPVYIGEAQK